MKDSKNNIQIALISLLLVLMAGCGQITQQQQSPQEAPVQAASIMGDCVVSYFQTDQAPYITQQQHYFNPETGYLQIVGTEPTGRYKFTLNKDNFALAKKPTPFLSGLPASFVNQPLATALFYSFTAGAGLLDTTGFETQETMKLEGQWYQPTQIPLTNSGIRITLLRNSGTNHIELVKVEDAASGTQWLLRDYNLRYSKDLETLVPRKIDVFDIRSGLASKQLIIQFEYKSVLQKEAQRIAK